VNSPIESLSIESISFNIRLYRLFRPKTKLAYSKNSVDMVKQQQALQQRKQHVVPQEQQQQQPSSPGLDEIEQQKQEQPIL
jgi:hypothetical protein